METNISNKCKAYTSLEQSKKLAEILPIESADMGWNIFVDDSTRCLPIDDWDLSKNGEGGAKFIPCWSLAALLSVTRNYYTRFELTLRTNKKYNLFAMTDNFVFRGFNEYPDGINNLIDACVVLIEKTHELKLL